MQRSKLSGPLRLPPTFAAERGERQRLTCYSRLDGYVANVQESVGTQG